MVTRRAVTMTSRSGGRCQITGQRSPCEGQKGRGWCRGFGRCERGGLIVDWKMTETAAVAAGLGAVVGTLAVPSLAGAMPDRQHETKKQKKNNNNQREPAR